MSKLQNIFLAVFSAAALLQAVPIGPDTAIVDEHTYYEIGYDRKTLKRLDIAYKFKYANPYNMDLIVEFEWNVYSNISSIYYEFIKVERPVEDKFTASVQEYLEDFEGTSLELLQTQKDSFSIRDVLATNIITPFLTIRRFRNYIRPWILSAKKSTNRTTLHEAVLQYINSVYKLKDGPFRVEFHFAMIAIILPHFIYDLKADDLAQGVIRGRKIGVKLKACHCIEIGIHGVAMGMFPIGIEWIQVAIDKIKSGDSSVDLSFAVDWLDRAIWKHDNWWTSADSLKFEAIYYSKPVKNMTKEDQRTWHKQITCKEREKMENILNPPEYEPFHLHWSVCKGDTQQTAAEKSKLFCWYEKEVDPVWKIGPLKAELLSTWPHVEVIRFYDLVTEQLMTAFKSDPNNVQYHNSFVNYELPAPKSYLATVFATTNHTLHRKLFTVSQATSGLRIGDLGVNAEAVTYVPGGHSFIHRDWHDIHDGVGTSRSTMAMLMIYIAQPEQGGETTFAKSNLLVEPILGSGILVHNLFQSGRMDTYAPHGAIGRKWGLFHKIYFQLPSQRSKFVSKIERFPAVISKDFDYWDQCHLKCTQDPSSRYEFLVNGKTKFKKT